MLKQAMKCDHEGDALILMKAARIVCEDIFKSKGFNFNGSFPSDCRQESLPTTLKSLVTMLLRGADLVDQDSADSQACLSVSQTILFNCKKPKKRDSAAKVRHSLEHEPPLPLYIGLNVHTQTRSKKLITSSKEHGHWVVKKTTNRFSSMPIDQAHEQNNELVKGSGGVVGLTENPSAFRKWMIAGPEQARLLKGS